MSIDSVARKETKRKQKLILRDTVKMIMSTFNSSDELNQIMYEYFEMMGFDTDIITEILMEADKLHVDR